jgi:hypothetical protein
MAAHRHFTSKLLMKWSGSDGLQLLNWQSLKLLVLRSQVSSINHHCYWLVVGFVGGNVWVCSDFIAELRCLWTYMFRILSFRDYPYPCHCFNLGDWFSWIKMWPHMWLACWLPTLFCYCTDHTELGQAVSFFKWGSLFSCCMECDSPLII